jgi:hypothetical protein
MKIFDDVGLRDAGRGGDGGVGWWEAEMCPDEERPRTAPNRLAIAGSSSIRADWRAARSWKIWWSGKQIEDMTEKMKYLRWEMISISQKQKIDEDLYSRMTRIGLWIWIVRPWNCWISGLTQVSSWSRWWRKLAVYLWRKEIEDHETERKKYDKTVLERKIVRSIGSAHFQKRLSARDSRKIVPDALKGFSSCQMDSFLCTKSVFTREDQNILLQALTWMMIHSIIERQLGAWMSRSSLQDKLSSDKSSTWRIFSLYSKCEAETPYTERLLRFSWFPRTSPRPKTRQGPNAANPMNSLSGNALNRPGFI